MNKIKIITVIGARPQFIKAAAVSRLLRTFADEKIIHTGQHYDANMSDVFFEELGIPKPDYQFHVSSGLHGAMTGGMLTEIEQVLIDEKPNFVLVYGDTNSTLAGALAASKLLIPVIHIEAGLRSFNKSMPEEQNRIITDHLSHLLFAPTETAIINLKNEGVTSHVYNVGDVMYDATIHFSTLAEQKSNLVERLGLEGFHLCTIHRAENTNNPERLRSICAALNASGAQIVLPIHPRTVKYLADYKIELNSTIKVIEPVGYLDMIALEKAATKIITDSGGVQKEAFFLGKPCITLRDETEWVETVENGWNVLVGSNKDEILKQIIEFNPNKERVSYFGDGRASHKIAELIQSEFNRIAEPR